MNKKFILQWIGVSGIPLDYYEEWGAVDFYNEMRHDVGTIKCAVSTDVGGSFIHFMHDDEGMIIITVSEEQWN